MTEVPDFSASFWEDHYREPGHDSHQGVPNPHLLAVAERLSPGRALDAGCGEGADAVRLAQMGWQVTGVDVSPTALEKAGAAAAAAGVAPVFECVDLTAWAPVADLYDLVTASYVHTTDDRAFLRTLGSAVKPGGVLLVVGHEPIGEHDVELHSPGSHSSADQVASYLEAGAWDVEVAEARVRTATSPDGEPSEDRDSVFLARKKAALPT